MLMEGFYFHRQRNDALTMTDLPTYHPPPGRSLRIDHRSTDRSPTVRPPPCRVPSLRVLQKHKRKGPSHITHAYPDPIRHGASLGGYCCRTLVRPSLSNQPKARRK
jgi:hypothetical protein